MAMSFRLRNKRVPLFVPHPLIKRPDLSLFEMESGKMPETAISAGCLQYKRGTFAIAFLANPPLSSTCLMDDNALIKPGFATHSAK